MSKIQITGNTKVPKEKISNQLEKLVKDRLHILKKKISGVKQDLEYYHRKYSMTDDEFLHDFENGELGDEEDYFVLKGSIKILKSLVEEQEVLQEVI